MFFWGEGLLASVGSVTVSTPSGARNNISKAIRPRFRENAGGSSACGWESQPNYSGPRERGGGSGLGFIRTPAAAD